MVATQRSSEMSSPIAVSLTETLASAFRSWMRSSMLTYASPAARASASLWTLSPSRSSEAVMPRALSSTDGGERGLERLAGDEAVGKALRQLVVANEPEDLLLARRDRAMRCEALVLMVSVEMMSLTGEWPAFRDGDERSKILFTGNRPPFWIWLSKRFQS